MRLRITSELEGIDLGDKRLDQRSKQVLQTLSVDPAASVNAACGTLAETMAAYRLFDNAQATPEAILAAHEQATRKRIVEQSVVLVCQDTTELDYSKHPPKDAQCLTKPERLGLFLHTQLAVTPEGVPLGVVGSDTFDRVADTLGQAQSRRGLPLEQKESARWLRGLVHSGEIAAACPQTRIVSIADREADMYDIFLQAQQEREANGQSADFIVRSKENRRLTERVPPSQHDSRNVVYRKLYDQVRLAPVRFEKQVVLPATAKREQRTALLNVRAEPVELKHPKNRRGLDSVRCNVVHVEEANCSAKAEQENSRVEWWLITSLPIATAEDIDRVIEYYRKRWTIETYFRVLKTGCRVEEIQLETNARLKTCLAFYQIIAWSVLYTTHLNRESPDVPCTEVFEDNQWQPVWRITTGQPIPSEPPTLARFVKLLASLGGYNNRPKEPPPGPQPIWVGIRRMHDFTLAWIAFSNDNSRCV